MSGFDVTDEALQAASFQLGVVVDDLGTEFAAVRTTLEQLVADGWSGGAARSFAAGWQEWSRGCADVMSALRSMAELLGSTGTTYESAETSTRSAVGSVRPGGVAS